MGERSAHYWRFEFAQVGGGVPVLTEFERLRQENQLTHRLVHRQINKLLRRPISSLIRMGNLVEVDGLWELEVAAAKSVRYFIGHIPDLPWGTEFLAFGSYEPGDEEGRDRIHLLASIQLGVVSL